MNFNTLLLLMAVWLLWQIHRDLMESNDRQRTLKMALDKTANRVEQLLEQAPAPAPRKRSAAARKSSTKASTRKSTKAGANASTNASANASTNESTAATSEKQRDDSSGSPA